MSDFSLMNKNNQAWNEQSNNNQMINLQQNCESGGTGMAPDFFNPNYHLFH